MSRFLMADCKMCSEPQISLEQCPACGNGYCEACFNLATIECSCGERVCFDCIGACCDILERVDRNERIIDGN